MIIPSYRLLVCASLGLLTACGTGDFLREKYTGERYGDPVVGARRAPVLNPGPAQAKQAALPPKIIPSAPPQQAASSDPYDQYDADGNETGRTNYIKEWMGDKPQAQQERKSFKGRVASNNNNAPAAPVKLTPQVETINPPPAITPVPEEENGVFIDLPQQRSENNAPAKDYAQLAPAAGKPAPEAYPHLSRVPRVPEAVYDIREERNAPEQELRMNHDAAMEQKKLLGEEPTELPPSTLPQVEGMLIEIDDAVHGDEPIIEARAGQ